jgi:putative membrane-bound dehydrogenase-like protein
VVFLACLPASAADPALPYKVGVAKVEITPDHAIRLNGFGFRRTESEGVYQKLHARALAVEDGNKSPVLLMTVDVLGIPADVYDELAKRLEKKAGLKKDRLAVTATHTHTGPMLAGANPTLFGVPIPKEHQANIDKYTPVFLDKLEAVALDALKDRKPAKLEWGAGKATFAMNRRTKGGPTDHDLPVLFVKDEKGKVRAVYLNYACHCVTLSHNKLGGDWAGYTAAAVEDTFADSVALVAIGCGADQNPNSGVVKDKEDVALGQGREIGAEVKRLSQNFLAPIKGEITAKVTTLELPLAALPTREQWEEKAKRMDAIGHHARVTLAKLNKGDKLPTKISYPVQTLVFGDSLAMVHLPGEVVVDYALRLKKELDGRRLWVTAYANHAPCYIPSERVLKEGGYEGGGAMIYYDIPAPFAPGLEDKIIAAVKEQIGKPFAAKFDPKKTGDSVPMSPQQSHSLIRTKPGLRVDLVAAEPLVADPVAIAFGPDGKLWVAEMADYPLGKSGQFDPGGRVVFLEDTDGDGLFDKSAVFLDNLPFPTGVLPWRKGVLVCAAPDILYAEDTDGDGKADTVGKLYSGFGTENYQARVNSLQYGLDGWVYGSCGLFGGNIKCARTGKTVALGDRDFRIKPDTGELEPATGRTQQGRVRDDRGNWFGCDNSNLIRHYVLEDHYLKRNPHVAYPNTSVNVAPSWKLFPLKADAQRFALSGPPGNVTAACGLGIYRDDLLGKEFYGNAFTCEPVNLLVTRLVLKPSGSTFRGVRAPDETESEFLASTDNWFRPVHVTTGPDGALWVADMYRYLIEHPRWIPPADLAKIDVRAGAGLGRIYRVRPADKPVRPWVRLDKLDTAGLVAALDSPNGWQRDMAMMMLVWKNDAKAKEPLEQLAVKSKRALTRLQALCTLEGLGQLDRKTAVLGALDSEPAVRQHGVRLMESRLGENPSITPWAIRTEDSDAQVRLQVAYTLGAWADKGAAGSALARMAFASDDPFQLAAVISSLHSDNLQSFGTIVGRLMADRKPPLTLIRDLSATAVGRDDTRTWMWLLVSAYEIASRDRTREPIAFAVTAGILDSFERQGKGWDKLPDEARKPMELVTAFARKLAEKDDAAEADLLAAIPLLGRDPATRAEDLKRLAGLLAATRPAAVQSAAIAALARTPDKGVPGTLIGAWASASPALRARILDALLARPAWHTELLTAIEKGTITSGQIDAARRQRLVNSPTQAVRERAEKLFAGGTNADRQKVIDDYKPALALVGDKTRGKAVFAKSCSACHALDGVGSAVGPDLAALANKTPLYLLSEIFDPNRNLDSRYAEYQVVTTDERTVSGILAAETATGITLRGQQGKEETILRADIQTLRGTAKSLMPEGLEKELTKENVADLFAYLSATDKPKVEKLDPKQPAELAKAILMEDVPRAFREDLVKRAVPQAADVVRAMVADLPASDAKEEYRRIPWVWRVSIAASRGKDPVVIAELVELSLPKKGEPLRDWQAVVLGGGVINGLSLEGVPPGKFFTVLMQDAELKKRWAETLKLSHAMADNEKVPAGTRYDALRIVALDTWANAEPRLTKYLAKSANAELQQGAVSGLADVEEAGATAVLVKALPDLTAGNRKFAVAGLLRTPARVAALLDALEKRTAKAEWLDEAHRDALLKHPDEALRLRATKLIGGP